MLSEASSTLTWRRAAFTAHAGRNHPAHSGYAAAEVLQAPGSSWQQWRTSAVVERALAASFASVAGYAGRGYAIRSAKRPMQWKIAGRQPFSLPRRAGSKGQRFNTRKWLTFWSCFFGYAVCYFTRQSLNYTAPVLQKAMGWEGLRQLGQLSSIFPLAYGSSRFLGGVLGDRMSPSKVFALGAGLCGALNVAFGLSSSLPYFVLFWFLNGCFQGLAAPPCVKMITNWFDPKERGQWWSVWHASINLGGFLIPFLSGGLAQAFGWRYGMLGPGCLALAAAALSLLLMRDGPEQPAAPAAPATSSEGGEAEGKQEEPEAPAVAKETEEQVGIVEGLLMDPVQWALGVGYLLVYICRYGLTTWGVFYLLREGALSPAQAAVQFSGFELGGFLGNFTAGKLSDVFVQKKGDEATSPGQRAKVVCLYFIASLMLIPLLAICPSTLPWAQYLLLLGIGHFLNGAQLLLPLVAAEVAPKSLLATATGFIGWVGYFGAAMAGLPLSLIVQRLGWKWYFAVLTGAATTGSVLLLPLRNLRTWKPKRAA